MDHQKSNFSLILALFLSEAVEASRCHFFENWWMKLKCPLLLKPLATIVQENSQSFYPSEPFRIIHFTMRHPVYIFWLWSCNKNSPCIFINPCLVSPASFMSCAGSTHVQFWISPSKNLFRFACNWVSLKCKYYEMKVCEFDAIQRFRDDTWKSNFEYVLKKTWSFLKVFSYKF